MAGLVCRAVHNLQSQRPDAQARQRRGRETSVRFTWPRRNGTPVPQREDSPFFECDKTGGIRSIAGSKYFVWRRQRRQKRSFVSCWTRSPYRRMRIAPTANGPPAGSHSCRLVEQLRQRRALDPPCLSPTWTIVRKMCDRYSVNVPDSIQASDLFLPKVSKTRFMTQHACRFRQ